MRRRTERETVFASQKLETSAPAGPTYRAFLLRCWREGGPRPGGPATWRFRLAQPGDGKAERGFAGLEALLAYLRGEMEGSDSRPTRRGRPLVDRPSMV